MDFDAIALGQYVTADRLQLLDSQRLAQGGSRLSGTDAYQGKPPANITPHTPAAESEKMITDLLHKNEELLPTEEHTGARGAAEPSMKETFGEKSVSKWSAIDDAFDEEEVAGEEEAPAQIEKGVDKPAAQKTAAETSQVAKEAIEQAFAFLGKKEPSSNGQLQEKVAQEPNARSKQAQLLLGATKAQRTNSGVVQKADDVSALEQNQAIKIIRLQEQQFKEVFQEVTYHAEERMALVLVDGKPQAVDLATAKKRNLSTSSSTWHGNRAVVTKKDFEEHKEFFISKGVTNFVMVSDEQAEELQEAMDRVVIAFIKAEADKEKDDDKTEERAPVEAAPQQQTASLEEKTAPKEELPGIFNQKEFHDDKKALARGFTQEAFAKEGRKQLKEAHKAKIKENEFQEEIHAIAKKEQEKIQDKDQEERMEDMEKQEQNKKALDEISHESKKDQEVHEEIETEQGRDHNDKKE